MTTAPRTTPAVVMSPGPTDSWVADLAVDSPVRQAALQEAGFTVRRVERITPTLEDVFVSLIEARDRADGAIQEVRR